MALNVTVLAEDSAAELKWMQELKAATGSFRDLTIESSSDKNFGGKNFGQVVFVDGSLHQLEARIDEIERRGRAVFILSTDAASQNQELQKYWSALIESGKADDILIFPFRPIEVQSKLRHYQQILMWEEVSKLNASFSGLISRLQEDLKLAERLQKNQAPTRFPEIKGFKVSHRYLAGLKSGGDYFDLGESKSGNQLSIVLSDSSSYGLSSSLLSTLMRVAVKLSYDDLRSCEETVRKIHEDLLLTLNDKDKLSLFYGVVSRKDYNLRYVNLGTSCAFYAQPGQNFWALPSQGVQITRESGGLPKEGFQAELPLEPKGRLALLSDGFVDVMGGEDKVLVTLNKFREAEGADFLNELVYFLKAKFSDPEDVPTQDCTGVLLDVDSKVLRKIN